MPELKHTFTGGKMEKDLDERIVPRGQYREALNIGVATSEDSDVGAAQNILGNIKVTSAIQGRTQTNESVGNEYDGYNSHIAEFINPQSDMLYRFVHTAWDANSNNSIWMDRIVEYDTTKGLDDHWEAKENAVFVDIFKVKDIIHTFDPMCDGSNKAKIKITNNINQLRWGMRVEARKMEPGTTIEDIDYQAKIITLDTAWDIDSFSPEPVTFYGDRNLNFSPDRKITGINVIDGMIFWTDNYSEPKKIDIERSKAGSKTINWTSTPGLQGRHSEPLKKIDDFNQHTVLVIGDTVNPNVQIDCMKEEGICPPYGCTDPTACNFDPTAVYDDGSCGGFGCTDSSALNYDASAACDDGSCCYAAGCTDPAYCEYSADACFDDGSCGKIKGCMDPLANNYDPTAECDDACEYNWSCLLGYGTDNCLDTDGIFPGGNTDIFDPSNWFSFPSGNTIPTHDVLGALFDSGSGMQTSPWNTFWYLNHVTTMSTWGGTAHQTNGNCTYQLIDDDPNGVLPGLETVLSKQKVGRLQIDHIHWGRDPNDGTLINSPSTFNVAVNNTLPSGSQPNNNAGTWAGGMIEPLNIYDSTDGTNTWENVITWLKYWSVFDGAHYYSNQGVQTLVPEIFITMTYQQVYDIITQIYNFGIGTAHVQMDITFGADFCSCGDYYDVPTCVENPSGVFTDENECLTCTSCDCNPSLQSWNCINGACQQIAGIGGTYQSIIACQLVCSGGSSS